MRYKIKILSGTVWYILKSFCYTQFKYWDDPLHRFHPQDFLKYFSSFFKREFSIHIHGPAKKKIKKLPYKVIAIGHSHQSITYRVGDKILLNTGNWRDEYTYSIHGKRFIPKQKSYAYVLHDENDVKLKIIHIPSNQPEITYKEVRDMLKRR